MRRLFPLVLLLALAPAGWAAGGAAPDEPRYPLGAIGALFDRLLHGSRPAPAPQPEPHYVVGEPYQLDGLWYYPRERFAYDETGIAGVYGPGHPAFTADGEAFDPHAMAGAHRTLQLPAVARVTNLENGRQVLLRLNDRGPASPARLIAVTPRVAQLLGFGRGGAARVRVELDAAASQALAQQLHGSTLAIAAAPVGAVQASALPPPGAQATDAPRSPLPPAAAVRAGTRDPWQGRAVPDRLPETATQGPAQPGALWIVCDSFTNAAYAERERANLAALGAQLVVSGTGNQRQERVRIGPIGSLAEADSLLNRVLHSGVRGARIVVEQE